MTAATVRSARHRKADGSASVGPLTMASVDQALAAILVAAVPGKTERVDLADAGGRSLASDVIARRSAPACDVSAMDGYAVRDADLSADWTALRVIGESAAGHGFSGDMDIGTAVRIFTGAPIPSGADRVVVQEDVRRVDGRVFVPAPVVGKRHIRQVGSDFRAGDILVEAGATLSAARLVAAAAADVAEVEVFTRPRVVVVSTGDELRAPGAGPFTLNSIPESVSFGVAEIARTYGGEVVARVRLPDALPLLQLAAAAMVEQVDLIVVIGGASVGERDHARGMFGELGLEMAFSKVAMRPGKPVWFGKASGAWIVGLPGNPTAALVTARLFLAPLVAGLAGREARSALGWRWRPLVEGLEATQQWECFIGARGEASAVRAVANRDSSGQSSLATIDTLIRRPPGQPPAAAGDFVEILDF